MINKIVRFKPDYVRRAKLISLQFSLFILLVVITNPDKTYRFITYESAFIILITIFLSINWYKFMRKSSLYRKIIDKYEDFRGFKENYLFVKLLEILAQQFFVILVFNFTQSHVLKYQLAVFTLIFVAVHFVNYVYSSVVRSTFFMLFSIPGSLLFYFLYDSMPGYGLGLAYFVHTSFYLVLGYLMTEYQVKFGELSS